MRVMKLRTPVQRLTVLTVVAALAMVLLSIGSLALDMDTGARDALAIAGAMAALATIGFAWALVSSVLAVRRSRT